MERSGQPDDLSRAFHLACFINADRSVAIEVATAALSKIEVAAHAQDKRLYYTPAGKNTRGSRTKIMLSEPHLLQRLVYVESERYERQMEQKDGLLDEEAMIIHFVKHLVRITIRRNSFYVNLGLSRLLHSYSTAEAMEIYNLAVQDPERVRDDYYYRSRKGRLMEEMKERFGGLLNVVKVARGEERFAAREALAQQASLVTECLNMFTPWSTLCVVPAGFDATGGALDALRFNGADPDQEHGIDVNRIHAIIHPGCFRKLVAALRYESPERRLEIPMFLLSSGEQRPPESRHQARLSEEETAGIKRALADQASRRRTVSAGLLRITVDGIERALIDLHQQRTARFSIASNAELIEVRTVDGEGELLLAAHLLGGDDDSRAGSSRSIVLEGGQRITFDLGHPSGVTRPADEMVVDVRYQEERAGRALALTLGRWLTLAGERTSAGSSSRGQAWRRGFGFAAIILLALTFFLYLQYRRSPSPESAKQDQVTPTPEQDQRPDPPDLAPRQAATPDVNQPQPPGIKKRRPMLPNDTLAERHPEEGPVNPTRTPQPELTGDPSDATRSTTPPPAGATLQQVKLLHVEVLGDEPLARRIKEALGAGLVSSNRFGVTDRRENADALLKVFAKSLRGGRAGFGSSFIVRLVNARGYVIWPATGSVKKYEGDVVDAASRILGDLLEAAKKE